VFGDEVLQALTSRPPRHRHLRRSTNRNVRLGRRARPESSRELPDRQSDRVMTCIVEAPAEEGEDDGAEEG
jgi:hypothetical protein